MEKLLILTDTACDIPQETAEELGIRILPIPLEVDGMGYLVVGILTQRSSTP